MNSNVIKDKQHFVNASIVDLYNKNKLINKNNLNNNNNRVSIANCEVKEMNEMIGGITGRGPIGVARAEDPRGPFGRIGHFGRIGGQFRCLGLATAAATAATAAATAAILVFAAQLRRIAFDGRPGRRFEELGRRGRRGRRRWRHLPLAATHFGTGHLRFEHFRRSFGTGEDMFGADRCRRC